MLKDEIDQRVLEEAAYMIEHEATVRSTACVFQVSKSTVHKDMAERLSYLDGGLWQRVRHIMEKNMAERHIRGGMATRLKYRKREQEKA